MECGETQDTGWGRNRPVTIVLDTLDDLGAGVVGRAAACLQPLPLLLDGGHSKVRDLDIELAVK